MTDVVNAVGKTPRVAILYIRDVPDDLHRRLRVAAAQRDESMRALVLRAVEHELDRLEADQSDEPTEG
jgi:plasmid stability protein